MTTRNTAPRCKFQASNDPDFRSSDVIAWTMEGTEIPPHGDFYAFLVKPASYRYLRVSRPPKSYHVFWWKPGLRFAEVRVFGTAETAPHRGRDNKSEGLK